MPRPQTRGFSCLLEPDGFSLLSPPGPWADLVGEWGGNGVTLGTAQLGNAGWGGGPLVTGLQRGGGAQKGLCRGSEKKFTYFCF